jgi:hypothetical protein
MIEVSSDHNASRLAGSLAHLNTGAGNPAVRIYGGTRAASITTAPSTPLLVQIPLTKPAGVVSAGVLTLTQSADGIIAASGVATWARVVNGNGDASFDCDAGEGAGPWEIQLVQSTLYAGGAARIISAVLG